MLSSSTSYASDFPQGMSGATIISGFSASARVKIFVEQVRYNPLSGIRKIVMSPQEFAAFPGASPIIVPSELSVIYSANIIAELNVSFEVRT